MIPATHPGTRPLTAVVLTAFLACACHTQRKIDLPGSPLTSTAPSGIAISGLKAGDTVQVTMKNGEQLGFPVQEVQQDALVARGGRRFLYQDMARLEKRQFAKGKTIALVVGITASALVLLLAVETASALAGFAGG